MRCAFLEWLPVGVSNLFSFFDSVDLNRLALIDTSPLRYASEV
jgi:hypothetical protein